MHGECEPLTSVCGDRGSLLFAAGHAPLHTEVFLVEGLLLLLGCHSGGFGEGLAPPRLPGLGHVQGFSSPQLPSCSSWAESPSALEPTLLCLSGPCWFPRAALLPEQAWTYTLFCAQC